MGRALLGGLLRSGHPAAAVTVVDPHAPSRALCEERYGVSARGEADAADTRADVIVLAVKPQQMRAVTQALAAAANDHTLYLSVAAGITSQHLAAWLGAGRAIVRCMPNTPALIGQGTAALYATETVSAAQRELASGLLGAVGTVHWLDDEALMDAVTALSGSGPAYFFLFIELLEKIGAELGLPAELARRLALETGAGATALAAASAESPAALRTQVTSPAGTTERALASFAAHDLEAVVRAALTAARDRSIELAAEVER